MSADAGSREDKAERERVRIIGAVVDQHDRAVTTNCPCLVEMGAYPSLEECTMWQMSGPDWTGCASAVLAKHDSAKNREVVRCYSERLEKYTDCIAMTACDVDARLDCDTNPLGCIVEGAPELGLTLAMECPDISLLPRVPE
ncbi:MAG TPA: hypothetical protein VJV78_01100 [Polyangiales bacterium]|nr:hypothetical protein [Polyangiales bacterium]